MERQYLTTPRAVGSPADAAAAMCGAHAQVLTAAEWSIGLRLAGATQDQVRVALWEERSLVKTFGPRGTVHLLPARDLPMWAAALSAVPVRFPVRAGVRLAREQAEEAIAAIGAALLGAELTIDELSGEVVTRAGRWAGELTLPGFGGMWPRWREVLPLAAYRGVLCHGPSRGRNVTYTSPASWLPGYQPGDPPSAVTELIRRYLYAYGPATPEQFAQWLAAPRRWAAAAFGAMGGDLQQVELDGSPAWLLAGDAVFPTACPPGVRLLPYFDAYPVAVQPRALLYPGRAGERALSRTGQAGTFPVLLIDGVVQGVWHQRRSGRVTDVTVEPIGTLTRTQRRGLDDEVGRLGEFLGATARLTIGPVSAGSHA
jgi:hypothetical protein